MSIRVFTSHIFHSMNYPPAAVEKQRSAAALLDAADNGDGDGADWRSNDGGGASLGQDEQRK